MNEANAIGTAFLRADLVAEPGRSELRQHLLEYARTRVMSAEGVDDLQHLGELIGRSLEAQSKLWPATKRLTVDVLCHNEAGIRFWRSLGYKDYCLTLEIMPPTP